MKLGWVDLKQQNKRASESPRSRSLAFDELGNATEKLFVITKSTLHGFFPSLRTKKNFPNSTKVKYPNHQYVFQDSLISWRHFRWLTTFIDRWWFGVLRTLLCLCFVELFCHNWTMWRHTEQNSWVQYLDRYGLGEWYDRPERNPTLAILNDGNLGFFDPETESIWRESKNIHDALKSVNQCIGTQGDLRCDVVVCGR